MPWRPETGGEPTLEALIRELLNPAALLDYLRSCVAFEEDERGNIVKKVAGYHQFRAVRKTRARVIAAQTTPATKEKYNGRPGGVVWHTQGSGKSLTMLMLAGTLARAAEMTNPTLVIVTDRIPPPIEAITTCRQRLREFIRLCRPKVVMAVGYHARSALGDMQSEEKLPAPVAHMPHPATALYAKPYNGYAFRQLRNAIAEAVAEYLTEPA